MRLLLLLSAFLTAMVGQGASARAAVATPCAIAACASAPARAAQAMAAVATPHVALLDRVNLVRIFVAAAPTAKVPLYADRLLI